MAEFEKEKLSDYQAAADAVLTLIMLKHGGSPRRRGPRKQAVELSGKGGNRQPRFDVELARARALSASGKSAGALNQIEAVLSGAKKYGYLNHEYETRLALGEVEIKSGKSAVGRARFALLVKPATRTGFLLIARKAKKAAP